MDVFRAVSGRVKGKPLGTKLKSRSSLTSFSVSSGSHSSTFFRKGNYAERACVGAPVNMDAAVLECLSAKVLELVANAGRDSKKSKIIPGQLQLIVRSDEELNIFLVGVTIAPGGGLRNIQAAFLTQKTEKKQH